MVFDENRDEVKNTYEKMNSLNNVDLSQDKFYQYFFNLLENGRNYCNFSFVRLVKSVDSTWVEAIEEAIGSLQFVVFHPRKFIEEEREIVNIAMARNVSTESIRHLLQHSNYIDEYRKDGTVIPNRILNVYKEESLNTYENRFIATLINELQLFVNKRFDAIFEASKDELGAYFEMDSTVDNYTETVDYKLRIKIRDKQTDVANENDESNIFTRVAKIHRLTNMLAGSEFMTTMRRFPVVRHPIVKTNVIGKNNDYKKCHKLWNFIYSYNQVGYKVNLMKQDPNISRDFESDIYNSFIWNYAMLHNYMEDVDALNIDHDKKEHDMEISDIRQLLEEIVRSVDMPEANLRKLITSELTNIQRKVKQEKIAAERIERDRQKRIRDEAANRAASRTVTTNEDSVTARSAKSVVEKAYQAGQEGRGTKKRVSKKKRR